MKTKSKILLVFSIVFMLLSIAWCIYDASEPNFYNYEGYIVSIEQNDKKQTVITTISGDKTSEFVLKWYSRKQYEKDVREIAVGDLIKLSTTQQNPTNIKKISVTDDIYLNIFLDYDKCIRVFAMNCEELSSKLQAEGFGK